jgi:hypothetical protein
MFPVRNNHHLYLKSIGISVNSPWRPISVFPVRYEYDLHIKSKAIIVKGRGGL